jgi:hypothetical protein
MPAIIKARTSIDESGRILNIDYPDVGFVYGAAIDHAANPPVKVVNELAIAAIHVEAAYGLAKSKVLIELVGPDILKAEIGFILGYFGSRCHPCE